MRNPLVPQTRICAYNLKTASIKSLEVLLETIMVHKDHQRAGAPFLQRQAERAAAVQPGKGFEEASLWPPSTFKEAYNKDEERLYILAESDRTRKMALN